MEHSPASPVTTRLYETGKMVEEGFGIDRIAEVMRARPKAVLWLDLLDPDLADLQIVQREFGLHPLAVEDAVEDHQRPKVDRYPNHLFMNVYAVRVDTGPEPALHKTEISAFVTDQALITVHKSEGDLDRLIERWQELRASSPGSPNSRLIAGVSTFSNSRHFSLRGRGQDPTNWSSGV